MPCPERTYAATTDREAIYSNATDPATLKMCTPTDPGYYATAGSEDQSMCSPGAAPSLPLNLPRSYPYTPPHPSSDPSPGPAH